MSGKLIYCKLVLIDFRRSKIRSQMGIELQDAKYLGKRVSRKDMEESDEDSQEETFSDAEAMDSEQDYEEFTFGDDDFGARSDSEKDEAEDNSQESDVSNDDESSEEEEEMLDSFDQELRRIQKEKPAAKRNVVSESEKGEHVRNQIVRIFLPSFYLIF